MIDSIETGDLDEFKRLIKDEIEVTTEQWNTYKRAAFIKGHFDTVEFCEDNDANKYIPVQLERMNFTIDQWESCMHWSAKRGILYSLIYSELKYGEKSGCIYGFTGYYITRKEFGKINVTVDDVFFFYEEDVYGDGNTSLILPTIEFSDKASFSSDDYLAFGIHYNRYKWEKCLEIAKNSNIIKYIKSKMS